MACCILCRLETSPLKQHKTYYERTHIRIVGAQPRARNDQRLLQPLVGAHHHFLPSPKALRFLYSSITENVLSQNPTTNSTTFSQYVIHRNPTFRSRAYHDFTSRTATSSHPSLSMSSYTSTTRLQHRLRLISRASQTMRTRRIRLLSHSQSFSSSTPPTTNYLSQTTTPSRQLNPSYKRSLWTSWSTSHQSHTMTVSSAAAKLSNHRSTLKASRSRA